MTAYRICILLSLWSKEPRSVSCVVGYVIIPRVKFTFATHSTCIQPKTMKWINQTSNDLYSVYSLKCMIFINHLLRLRNAATHSGSVCAVHLCNGRGRFPGSSMSCFDLWHCVQNLMTDERTQTSCHVRCPAEGRTTVVPKIAGKRTSLSGRVEDRRHSKLLKLESLHMIYVTTFKNRSEYNCSNNL